MRSDVSNGYGPAAAVWKLVCWVLAVTFATLPQASLAKGAAPVGTHSQRYIIELRDPPLAEYDGRALSGGGKSAAARLEATAPRITRAHKLDMHSPATLAYLDYIGAQQSEFRLQAARLIGREVTPVHTYRTASNGMALDLTAREAAELAGSPLVKSISRDTRYRLQTYAGPEWIGADQIWSGAAGFPSDRGEGIVIGVLDSGINWDHASFADPSPDGYNFSNPLGEQLGLCDDPEVLCSDKLIGVYDFVEDDPSTDEVEENTKGHDNDFYGHGSHVASIAAGNPISNVSLSSSVKVTISGVAPRSNLIVYRVCYAGDDPPDSSSCMGSAVLSAIDQAVEDGVDVINYSVGSDAGDPWAPGSVSRAYLTARSAGIVVVTSAGNEGPNAGTIGSPANAPWIVGVGAATHDKFLANRFDLSGGPTALACLQGNGPAITSTIGPEPVVFAGEVGDPMGCSAFPVGSMSDSIALVSRGGCTFVTKAANAAQAGADMMVVYNNVAGALVLMELGGSTIPACMIENSDGIAARDFVQATPAATGQVKYPTDLFSNPFFGDAVAGFSSRGPQEPPVEDTLKPNLIAPGVSIVAASNEEQKLRTLSGTSMASPHVAGAAALLKSVHADWSASQIISALETTATAQWATDQGGAAATPWVRGAGHSQLGEAANAGLYLDVTQSQFLQANPASGGNPGVLNLPGLVDSKCQRNCSFTRTVTDQMGGGNWTATAVDFPPGMTVTVTPSSFTLGNAESRSLNIDVDVTALDTIGEWVDGRVRLSAAGSPDQYFTLSVLVHGGDLPAQWEIDDDRNGGWQDFALSGLAAMPEATFHAGGLVQQTRTEQVLVEDPSRDDVYDGGAGVYTVWHDLPQGGLWLHAETLASTAEDLDLFVGRDDNHDGVADEEEELCHSYTPQDIEQCDLYSLPPGDYWVLVQNWEGGEAEGDDVTLLSVAIPDGGGSLAASGPGIVPYGAAFDLRLSWDNLAALPGEQWFGAVAVGTRRDHPDDIGVIPLRFNRTGIAAPATFPLFDGVDHELALGASAGHDRLFIDVPPGASRLTVSADARDANQNDSLSLELRRLDFVAALIEPPFTAVPDGAVALVSDTGGTESGPSVVVSGASLQPGRWYAVLTNGGGQPAAVKVRADLEFQGTSLPIHRGLWEPISRPGLSQGYDYNWGTVGRSLIWYTYGEDHQSAWYIAGSPASPGNVWVSDLYRVTNDGMNQQLATVGRVGVTILAEDDALFSFTLFGESGTDRMQPLSALSCPQIEGAPRSYTGIWYRGEDGLGGASVLVNSATQAQIHYLFDAAGLPRWLFAQDLVNPEPTNAEMPMLQFTGYCAVCANTGVSSEPVGVLTRDFTSETAGSWNLDYLFQPPLSGSVERTDQIIKLTGTLDCL